jgi:RNA polymerase sigma factor (TIGR02999 family)
MRSDSKTDQITELLQRHRSGDRDAFDRLVGLVYHQLRQTARRQVARGWAGRTLDTTALVHEAYLVLVGETAVDWQDRQHFFAITARVMRRILVDHARYRGALKRGGGRPAVDLDRVLVSTDDQLELVLIVDEAVTALEAFNPRLARVVECRYFAGLSEEETASALGTSLRTVQRDWMRARAWLLEELE